MQSSNPAFSDSLFNEWAYSPAKANAMSVRGTASKCLLLLTILTACAAWTWSAAESGAEVGLYVFGGLIGGMVLAFATIFKPNWAPYTAPLYAAAEGLFLGAISFYFNARYGQGIAFNALVLTLAVTLAMLGLYTSRIIPMNDKVRTGIVAATAAVFLAYLATWILSMFGVPGISYIHGGGTLGIAISGVIVVVAALNLLLDFDFIEQGARVGAPKAMEWYGAFALLVTLVWLYISLLRLLSKLQRD